MLSSQGVPDEKNLKTVRPPLSRRGRGPVVWVECFEEIPCDPCHDACPVGAIHPFPDINDCPSVDHEACTGCGLCITACPGLAIFVVDESRDDGMATIRLPYELLPVPEVDDAVQVLDRAGHEVGTGRVVLVDQRSGGDRTAVIEIEVAASLAEVVRAIRVSPTRGEGRYCEA